MEREHSKSIWPFGFEQVRAKSWREYPNEFAGRAQGLHPILSETVVENDGSGALKKDGEEEWNIVERKDVVGKIAPNGGKYDEELADGQSGDGQTAESTSGTKKRGWCAGWFSK